MKFGELAVEFQKIELTSLRNRKMEILAELIARLEGEELKQAIYLSLGRLGPLYDSLELNLAEKMAVRVVAWAMRVAEKKVWETYKEVGDLGNVVARLRDNKFTVHSSRFTVGEVYKELVKIAKDSGTGSQERKVRMLGRLLQNLDSLGAKYVVRLVVGRLRLGFSEMTVLDGLSFYLKKDKSLSRELEEIYQVAPDIGELAKVVRLEGIEGARRKLGLEVGRPIMPALAQRLRTADEMIEKMGRVVVEPKFDGQREQIHLYRFKNQGEQGLSLFEKEGGVRVQSFTRSLEDNTAMFPELEGAKKQIKAESVILDAEVVGFDKKTGKMVPFQVTMRRKRKYGIGKTSQELPVKFFVFDIMYKNGKSLIELPLVKRRQILRDTIKTGEVLVVDEGILTNQADEIRSYHKEQLDKGLEGVMVKRAEGKYRPGRKGWNWVKFKEEEGRSGKLADTLDCLVMGYYVGKGKRNKFGLGAFLVGIKNRDKWVTIAKIGTGLTDEEWRLLYQKVQAAKSHERARSYKVAKELEPDGWTSPEIVVEVSADEITKSPIHTSGYALRFPRLVRFREDKRPEEVTTLTEVEEIRQASGEVLN